MENENESLDRILERIGQQQNQPAYELPDQQSFTVDLAIDRVLSRVSNLAPEQRQAITLYLDELPRRQLSKLLWWMEDKAWTGEVLLTFVDFMHVWATNRDYWEVLYWDWRLGAYLSNYNVSSLRREDAYALVVERVSFGAEEIIDPKWHWEWTEYTELQPRYGSFARYALYRMRNGRDVDALSEDEDESLFDSDDISWNNAWEFDDPMHDSNRYLAENEVMDLLKGILHKDRNYDG